MKNLLVIHLECCSLYELQEYWPSLPNLRRLVENSFWFRNCSTSGGSTIFAFNGVSQGSISGLDHLTEYDHEGAPVATEPGLFELLREKHGYATQGILLDYHHNPITKDVIANNLLGLGQPQVIPCLEPGNAALEELFGQWKRERRHFACFVHNYYGWFNSDIVLEQDYDQLGFAEFHNRGVTMRDAAIGKLLAALDATDQRDDTIVLAYGDHGHNFYSRRFWNGECFGPTLGASVTRVPLFVHNSRLGTGISTDLASLDDIRATCLGLLFPDVPPSEPATPFPGVDLNRQHRKLCFIQNKYAQQRETDSPLYVRKAYAVTDGELRLIVSSLCPKTGKGGMELYYDRMDPGSATNLLDFFELDAEGMVIDYHIAPINRPDHYFHTFNPQQLAKLAERYLYLRDTLRLYVEKKEKMAVERSGARVNLFPPASFLFTASLHGPNPAADYQIQYKGIKWLKRQERPILLYGASGFGRQILYMLRFHRIPAAGFVDRSSALQAAGLDDLPVFDIERIVSDRKEALVLGCARNGDVDEDMRAQCEKRGLDYCSYNIEIRGFTGGSIDMCGRRTRNWVIEHTAVPVFGLKET